ncbi:MAG: hypothetical protein NTV36_02335 [Candidatus Staskawiczbacteria bacterium]|nr:hypothetical protein [Candidatus Staskawiczbacteria bacterium]
MINLLPPQSKEILLLDKVKKLAIILCTSALIVLVCLAMVLVMLNLQILVESSLQEHILNTTKEQTQTNDYNNYENLLTQFDKRLQLLKAYYNSHKNYSKLLEEISTDNNPGKILFSNIYLSPGDGGIIKAKISGTSSSREALLAFKKKLEGTAFLANIYFSPESWINPQNINFSVTFDYDLTKK